jgi:thermitase
MRSFSRTSQRGWVAAGAIALATISFAELALAKEYIVKLKDKGTDFVSSAVDFGIATQSDVTDQHADGRLLKISVNLDDRRSEAAALVRLMKNPDVEYVVENVRFHALGTVNDPRYAEQWALAKVNAERAWDKTPGSKNVVVAVIDTGIDHTHEDLKDNMWINADEVAGNNKDDDNNGYVDDVYGYDFRDNDADPQDLTSDKNPGHGTHCAGIIGAVGNNAKGISGINQSVSLMAVRFLGADGSGDLMTAAKAIDYAVNNGANVISASWGAAVQRSAVEPILEAVQRAADKNIIFVAAAANDGANNDTREVYPANGGLANMISVAASQSDDTKPSWSNFGKMKVDLASPGHKILSTLPANKYGELSGTSMATPLVAGLVAMIHSSTADDAQLDGPTVKSILQASGTQVGIETACNCRVDAPAALDVVEARKLTVVPNAVTIAPEGTVQFSAFGGQGPYKFAVDNSNVAGLSPDGAFKGIAEGEAKVTVTDSTGQSASSLIVRVAKAPEQSAECPLGDPMICMLMCAIQPDLPWCNGQTPELPVP